MVGVLVGAVAVAAVPVVPGGADAADALPSALRLLAARTRGSRATAGGRSSDGLARAQDGGRRL
eukprot:1258013-Alexandrium_andersonii.AAC.1